MESNNYEGFITSMVENFLPRFSNKDICMTMTLRMDWNYYKNGKNDISFHKNHFLLFNRPSNYTKVLYKDVSEYRIFYPDMQEEDLVMEILSDHDSCWRFDGMRWIFKSFTQAWDFFEEKGIEGREISPFVHWDLSGEPAYRHLLKLEPFNKEESWNGEYFVKVGKKIYMDEISKYMPKEMK